MHNPLTLVTIYHMTTTYRKYFTTAYRSGQTPFLTVSPDAPEWVQTTIYEAHDGELPNDWRYLTAANIFDFYVTDSTPAEYDPADTDAPYEIADSLTDIYTADLLDWYSADISRTAYADDDLSDPGEGLVSMLSTGQYLAILQMAETIAAAILENETTRGAE